MTNEKTKVGFALCGSFCTFEEIIPQIENLIKLGYEVVPIMSEYSYKTDTRFGTASYFIEKLETVCGNKVIASIKDAEPIGPKKLLDVLVIAPCTGNTLGKLAYGINDSCVTMAAKSHLRNERPVVIAVSTNDALGNSAKNIGSLLNYKNIFFVPMKQDDPVNKPKSVISDFSLIPQSIEKSLEKCQLQPVWI